MKTWSRKIEKLYCYRDYELYLDDKLVAIASSKWIAITKSTGKIIKFSNDVADKYKTTDVSIFEQESSFDIDVPENFTNFYTYTIQRRDIDTNHHVNNLFYLDFAYSVLPEGIYEKRFDLNNIKIIYKKELKLGDSIKSMYSFENNKHTIVISSKDEATTHAIICLY